jgi:NitT/TauT family transport system substrate-binding protein
MLLKRLAGMAAAIAVAACLGAGAHAQDKVRLSFNPQIYSYLPLFLAVDKGYFKEQNIDVEVITYSGSALTQIPMLARGDQDIAAMIIAPGFFNQYTSGFGIKLISSISQPHKGWHDNMWVMVRKEVWDARKPKTLADLKGATIELGPKGAPIYLLSAELIRQSGLKFTDFKTQERLRGPLDAYPMFKNKAMDVLSMVEPIVGRLEADGLAVRWKPALDVMPWYQESYLAANPKFLTEKRDVTKRFLKGYIKAVREISAGNGKWSPDMIASVAKWSKLSPKLIATIPGPSYVGQAGDIDQASIERQQKIWMEAGLVKTKSPLADMVDASLLDEARKEIGVR